MIREARADAGVLRRGTTMIRAPGPVVEHPMDSGR